MMRSTSILPLLLLVALAGCDSDAPEPSAADSSTIDSLPAFEAPEDTASLAALPGIDTARVPEGLAPEMPTRLPAEPSTGDAEPPANRTPQTSTPAGAPAPPVAAPSAPATGASALLERTEQRYADLRSMSADFVQHVYVPLLESEVDSRGNMYHKAPDRFAMRFTQPDGDVVVSDGRYLWMYYPSTDARQVMRTALAGEGQRVDLYREFLSDANERFNVTANVAETVDGRSTRALTLVPRGPSPYEQVRLWIDAQDALVRRFEITEENGTLRDIRLSNLRPNADLADSLFRFDPPPNTQVHDF